MLVDQPTADTVRPLASFIGAAKGAFRSVEEVDAFIRSERDQWEP